VVVVVAVVFLVVFLVVVVALVFSVRNHPTTTGKTLTLDSCVQAHNNK